MESYFEAAARLDQEFTDKIREDDDAQLKIPTPKSIKSKKTG